LKNTEQSTKAATQITLEHRPCSQEKKIEKKEFENTTVKKTLVEKGPLIPVCNGL
jgi:hypothetical protein